jgi:3-oxoacyl-[acyl-carrier-protein] synthase-3
VAPKRKTHSVIAGTGSYLPDRVIENTEFLRNRFYLDYEKPIDPADNPKTVEKFRAITDIGERRYVGADLVASDLATFAARRSLDSSGIDGESLDYLIVAHNFGDIREDNRRSDFVPSLAGRVKKKLEIANPRCVAYDLPFGCAGWLQGVIQADYFLQSGDAKRAMVIGAETLSRVSDPSDRDSMLYSDGAGCVILEARTGGEAVGVVAHATRSDALEHGSLMWMGGSYDPDYPTADLFLKMRGRKLYEYAVRTVPELVHENLRAAGMTLDDVDKILVHQANAKMNEAILKRLFQVEGRKEIPPGVMPMTISHLGNSSVATLPTMLDLMLTGRLDGHGVRNGDVMVFAAVGAGMNTNSLIYRWP